MNYLSARLSWFINSCRQRLDFAVAEVWMTWINAPISFGTEVLKDADKLTKRVAGEVLQKVITQSPVDSGAFRGNWRTKVDSVDSTVNADDKDKSGQGAINQGLAVIASGAGVGKTVFVANSLPYAVRLNSGHSEQAPANFVELSVQSVVNKYR